MATRPTAKREIKMIASLDGDLAVVFWGGVIAKVGVSDGVELVKLVDVVEIGEAREVEVDDMEDDSEALTFVASLV